MATDLKDVKYQVAIANRILAELGLATGVTASLGHASWRVPNQPDTFVVKGRGYEIDALALMRPEEMVVCDLEGFKIDGPPGSTQCREVKMHSCVYKSRPDVMSVTHIHPRYTILMTVLEATLVPMCQEGIQLVRNPLPVYPHVKTVWSEEEGQEVAKLLGNSPAILLKGHGATTVGTRLEESVMRMLHLEEQAKMNYLAYSVAGANHPRIPDEHIDEMTNRTPYRELPHFREEVKSAGKLEGGVWDYYSWKVSQDI
jgi:ribulose-5-phosphate 4-epimerase/fuculose-1-phosphate aldolase